VKLRQRLGFKQGDPRRPRAPRRCWTCKLTGHNSARCEIDVRMRELTRDDYWTFETWPMDLPVPSNIVPMRRRA
jgi:hypothetical protein